MAKQTEKGSIYKNIVGRNIERYRTALKLSVPELAKKAGIHRSTLFKLEKSGDNYSNESLNKIADALEVKIKALFEEDENEWHWKTVVVLDVYTSDMISRDSRGFISFATPKRLAGGISNIAPTKGEYSDKAFAFIAPDDSMRMPARNDDSDIRKNDLLIVDPLGKRNPNKVVLAIVYRKAQKRSEVVVRRYAVRGEQFELIPNDDGYSKELSSDESIDIEIIGTVEEIRRHPKKS